MKLQLNKLSYPLTFLLLTLAGWGTAFSQTFSVNCNNGDDLHLVLNGTTPGPNGSAIAAGDIVDITGTCYANGAAFTNPSGLNLTLNGVVGSSGSKAILDGGNASGVVATPPLAVVRVLAPININNLTIQNGRQFGISMQVGVAINSFINNSSVINNGSATADAGIDMASPIATVYITNTTVVGNPNGINTRSSLVINQSTITGNTVRGLFVNNTAPVNVTVDNSIIAGNTVTDVVSAATNLKITLNKNNIYGTTAGDSGIVVNPGNQQVTDLSTLALGTLGDNGGLTPTISLNAGSVAINFVPIADCAAATTDQRGAPKPGVSGAGNKAACDAGAYETGDAKLIVASSSSNPVNFPAVNLGQSSNAAVSVTNSGNSTATGSGNYLISDSVFSIATAANDLSIPINSSTALPLLTFTPTQAGTTSNGTLSINYNNTGASPLVLSLAGASNPAAPTPQMKDIIAYVNQAVKDKTIMGLGKNILLAKLRLIAYRAGLAVTDQLIKNNRINEACALLRTLVKTSDGQANPADLIKGTGVAQLNQNLSDLRAYIGCTPITPLAADFVKDNDAGNVTAQ